MARHTLKKCNKCGEHKNAPEFYPDKRRKEGIRTTCMQCDKASNDAQKMDPVVRAAVIEVGIKTCNTCGEALPISAFTGNRRTPDGFDINCRECVRTLKQKSRYGITQAEKDAILDGQGGVCAICGTSAPGKHGWHTDHCHDSLKVRGVLCDGCNRALGFAKDNPTILRTMAAYIEMHAVA